MSNINRRQYYQIDLAPYIRDPRSDSSDLPTDVQSNPHLQTTLSFPKPTLPPKISVAFTRALFPRVVVPFSKLVANFNQEQVDVVRSAPNNFIAIIPFGSFKKVYEDHTTYLRAVEHFLKTLGYPNSEHLVLSPPTLVQDCYENFEGICPLVLSNAGTQLRDFMLWQQTFAISRDITFHAFPFDSTVFSWVIMHVTGNAVENTAEAATSVVNTVKKAMFNDPNFRACVSRILTTKGIAHYETTVDELAYTAINSFHVRFVDYEDMEGNIMAAFQFMGKPWSSVQTEHEEFLSIIQNPSTPYVTPEHRRLTVQKKPQHCIWCKADTHPARHCPFTHTLDWLGPRD